MTWHFLGLALLPYAVGLAGYGAYALQDLPSFVLQLSGNVSGLAGEATGTTRFGGLIHPWSALCREILERYVSAFNGESWSNPYRLQLLVLLVYWGGAVVALLDREVRRQPITRLLLPLAAIFFAVLWLFEGLKLRAYIVYTLPLFAGLGAAWIWKWTEGRRFVRASVVAAIVCVQFLGIGFGVWKNQYRERASSGGGVYEGARAAEFTHHGERSNSLSNSASTAGWWTT